ncbi:transcription initiation protein SPT3 homolog isoform X2 [Lycorma delicatula]
MASMDAGNDTFIFAKEIQMMMFGLGDSQNPLLATAQVIELVVKQQLTLLLYKADEVSKMRQSSNIELQDILFLMRKDKVKLKRLLQYLELKDSKMGLPRLMEEIDPAKALQHRRQLGNRKEECLRFLSSIGVHDVYEDSVEDRIKMERLIRADQIAQSLNEKSYQEFHKSRKCSFAATRLNQVKLLDWLKTTAPEPISKLKKEAVDVLIYLAKETVAQLIDMALLVRQDAIAIPGDPLSRAIDPLPTTSSDTFCSEQNQ